MSDRPSDEEKPATDPAPTPPPAGQEPAKPAPAGYPPVPPYPPVMQQAPPKRPSGFKSGFGTGAGVGLGFGAALVVLSVVTTVLGMIVMMAFSAMAASMVPGNSEIMATVWGKETAKDQLRSIPVRGAIQNRGADGLFSMGGVYGYEVADLIDGIEAEDAQGLVLMLDTPGGTVSGSKAMADAVDRYRERTGKKVFAFVESMSASGGMYTMAGADEIVSDHSGVVGSVGVIMGPIERYRDVTSTGSLISGSVTAGEITSEYITAGTGKDAGNPFRDLTPAERAELQAIVDSMYDDFVTHVATKRDIPRERIVGELGAGMFTGERAIEVGYIDAVMGRDEAMRHFATAAGLDPEQTKIVESSGPTGWASLLGIERRPFGVSPAAKAEGGQPPRVTARICSDPAVPLTLHGNLASVCR